MMDRRYLALVAAVALAAGCDRQATDPGAEPSAVASPMLNSVASIDRSDITDLLAGMPAAANAQEGIAMVNERLAARGLPIALQKVEYVTGGPGATEVGQTVFATDRQLRLDSKWVPSDARRLALGNALTQVSSLPFAPANFGTALQVDGIPSVDASFNTWNDVQCSNLDILTLAPVPTIDSAVLGIGDPFVADIVTIGFLPGALFDAVLGPGAANNVLGVTFTFWFIDGPGGPPTDVDGNGRLDTALKEVWYNDAFVWSTDGSPGTDIETVALHENGHALELGHFGRVAIGNSNGKLHVSPRAVMNAFILGALRAPLGTDNAAYCSNFASWPS